MTHRSTQILALFVSLAATSCGATPPIAPPTRPTVQPSPEPTTTPVEATSASPKAPSSPLPPSGVWDLTARPLRDSCTPKVATGAKQLGVFVFSREVGSKVFVNVPLFELAGATLSRSDVLATAGSSFTSTAHPDTTCPGYEVRRGGEVTEVMHDRLVIHRTTTYGDRSGCTGGATNAPSMCEAELEETYSLSHADCELPCTGKLDNTNPKAPKMSCVCP